jgi:hypothetical protein
VKRVLKPVVGLLAVIYFLVDAVFLPVARRISNRIAGHWMFARLRGWITSLRPYPTLLLFAVPVIVLEPVKPAALYLIGTGRIVWGAMVFAGGELLKLVLVERLFSLTRDKLLSIPAFAFGYARYRELMQWLTALEAWQAVRRWSRAAQYTIRRHIRALRAARKPRRLARDAA